MKKDIGAALSSPTGWILAGGLVYVAYRVWKSADEALRAVGKKAEPLVDAAVGAGTSAVTIVGNVLAGEVQKVEAIPGPATESATAALTASIVDPPYNGTAQRGLGAWSLQATVAINNPGEKKPVELKVVVKWNGWFWSDVTQTVAVVEAPNGRTLYKVTVPMTLINAMGASKTMEAFLNGQNTGGAVVFSVK